MGFGFIGWKGLVAGIAERDRAAASTARSHGTAPLMGAHARVVDPASSLPGAAVVPGKGFSSSAEGSLGKGSSSAAGEVPGKGEALDKGKAPVAVLRHSTARWASPARGLRDWIALGLLMVLACATFLVNLTVNGYGNEFYAAAAQAGSQSWWAYLWGASDAAASITVDKPPASLWVTALFVRAMGLSSLSILLPQALMGIGSTYLVYAIARRYWGNAVGIAAGAIFATTPITVLMFRFNNPDALLVLLMLGAAGCVLRALECVPTDSGANASHEMGSRAVYAARTRWFALAGVLIGFGFLTKQLQVALVLPGFALAMFACAGKGVSWPRRVLDAVVALGSMVIAAGWWVLLTVLVPSGSRPYIGGSETDSFVELTFSYNGLGRLTGNENGAVVPGGGSGQAGAWGETGIARLLGSDFAGQFSWLAPMALAGVVVAVLVALWLRRRREAWLMGTTDEQADGYTGAAAVDGRAGDAPVGGRASGMLACNGTAEDAVENRGSLVDAAFRLRLAFTAIFGGWLVVTWLTFSFMAGIFHQYYTVALTPAVALMAAVCAAALWRMRASGSLSAAMALPVLVLLNAFWAAYVAAQANWVSWFPYALLAAGLLGAVLLMASPAVEWLKRGDAASWPGYSATDAGAGVTAAPEHSLNGGMRGIAGYLAIAGAVVSTVALMAGPVTWSVYTIATAHTGSIVTAGPGAGGMGGGPGMGGGRGNGGVPGMGGAASAGQDGPGSAAGAHVAGDGQGGPGNGMGPGGGMTGNLGSAASDGAGGTDGVPMGDGRGNGGATGDGQDGLSGGSGGAAGGASTSDGMPSSGSGAESGGPSSSAGGMGNLLGGGGASTSSELKALLLEDADSYDWVAATTGSQSAASYQLATERSVMPIGGFNGSDPSPTLEQFKQLVAAGRIHYYIAGGGMGGGGGSNGTASQIQAWVEENFTAQTVDGVTLYDLSAAS